MITVCCIISIILLFQFRTEWWLEYCKLLTLNEFSFYRDYELKKLNDVTLEYLEYLKQYHNCFFVKLITCPICLTTWLSIIAGIITCSFCEIPIFIVISLIIFGIINKLV